MPKVRLGVALLVPPPLAVEIDGLRRALGDGALGRIPVHLTLVPPVNVAEHRVAEALGVLRAAASVTRPFTVALGPPATFLPANPVLYLPAAEGAEAVVALRERVFRDPLARPLTWPFVPHVTLADEAPPDVLAAAVVALARYRVEVGFERLHLLREQPGRVWEPVADAAFAPVAVVGRGGLPLELHVTERLDPEASAFAEREWATHAAAPDGEGEASRPFALTARRHGRVVGAATGRAQGGSAHLARLIVAAGERGQGIGAHLLAAVESLAAEAGCRSVTARAPAGGAAEGFYRARGWVATTRLPGWRGGRDFVVLRRDLA